MPNLPAVVSTPVSAQPGAQVQQIPANREVIVINPPGGKDTGGWSEATPTIVAAVAWPITILIGLALFRKSVSGLIDRIKTVKAAGVEVSTDALIREELPARDPKPAAAEVDPLSSPIETIVTAWVRVEKAARDAVIRVMPAGRTSGTLPYATVLRNIDSLQLAGLNPQVRSVVWDLAKIRNQAVHNPDEPIGRDSLIRFVANADWATDELNQLQPSLP